MFMCMEILLRYEQKHLCNQLQSTDRQSDLCFSGDQPAEEHGVHGADKAPGNRLEDVSYMAALITEDPQVVPDPFVEVVKEEFGQQFCPTNR